ncbi:hypothetical protein P0F76_29100, partial [Pseudomonas paraeruginosa]|uniref:hypothetical protein n=1 Tax=Pseudomonas paraeruginosa TaxID=2994495 RepID=UPI0024DE12F8
MLPVLVFLLGESGGPRDQRRAPAVPAQARYEQALEPSLIQIPEPQRPLSLPLAVFSFEKKKKKPNLIYISDMIYTPADTYLHTHLHYL